MNWFSPNSSYQDGDKDDHPHLERIFVKSFLSFFYFPKEIQVLGLEKRVHHIPSLGNTLSFR